MVSKSRYATAVCDFRSPMQSWGGPSRNKDATTERAPTYSALVGFLNCCAGIRGTDPAFGARVGFRVDRPGLLANDTQATKNLNPDYNDDALPRDVNQIVTASGRPWEYDLVLVNKAFIADATYTVFFEVPSSQRDNLAAALANPYWTPCAGRAAHPMEAGWFLGVTSTKATAAAETVPAVTSSASATTVSELTMLQPAQPAARGWEKRTHADEPAGLVGDQYFRRRRWSKMVAVPTVGSTRQLWRWASDNLDRPDR